MIRDSFAKKYSDNVYISFKNIINQTRMNLSSPTDLLVCQQGGFLNWDGSPSIGMGEVGIDNIQKLNTITNMGNRIIVDNDDYFVNNGNQFFTGMTKFEENINTVCKLYLDIWENEFFLRTLAEFVRLINGEHYDWNLNMSEIKDTGRGDFIRTRIIHQLDKYPDFQQTIKNGYNSNFRNAVAHSQYHLVPGGIKLDNFGRSKYATDYALSFEQWEKLVTYAWFIFRTLFSFLKDIKDSYFMSYKMVPLAGIRILVPIDDKWDARYIYPDDNGNFWRFVKANHY